jgi:septum formation protein
MIKKVMKKKIILASTSPYRKKLLERLNIPFVARNPGVDEDSLKERFDDPQKLSEELAKLKAKSALRSLDEITIGSDQVLDLEGRLLGKPGSKEKAIEQLLEMQGKEHTLITAVCIFEEGKEDLFTSIAKMKMRPLDREAITRYVDYDNPIDCAGSYKLESLGISLFESVSVDDSTGIVGLPLIQLAKILRQKGLSIP